MAKGPAFEPVYRVSDALYINLTNRCGNACEFCVREGQDGVGDAKSLWLEREPAAAEVLDAWRGFGPEGYTETVFCGYGEPAERLAELLEVARAIKGQIPGHRVRLNTNGQGSLLAGRDITPELAGVIDCVSVSLNASNAEEYVRLCRPRHGEDAYAAMLAFAQAAQSQGLEVILSIVDGTTNEDAARAVAQSMGMPLRVRGVWG